jgi:NitT/TauT family transport system substrate-binding protein
MDIRPRRTIGPARVGILALALTALAAGGALGQSGSAAPASSLPERTALTVGLGYIPSVQFAQFYRAEEAGYYDAAGLDVKFEHKTDPEIITLLGQGAFDIGMSDGTSVIPAVSQGIPVVYAATIYARFPNVVFAKAGSGINEVADLAGKRIGIPGRFGSSWIMLQALLATAGLTADDVKIVTYTDFGQGIAVAEGQVDAATGYIANDPVRLERAGIDVVTLRIDGAASLPGPGLVVGSGTLETKREALRAFVAATFRAMDEIIADPQKGLDATFARVPELASDPETQRAILEATIDSWQSDYTRERGLGAIDRDAWVAAVETMASLPDPVVFSDVSVDDLVTDELWP